MTSRRRSLGFIAAVVCSAVCAASCSHPINDDGNDITNPMGKNTGITSHILTLTPSATEIGVGQGAGISAMYDGVALADNVPGAGPVITVSDPSVISCCGLGVFGYSVGTATYTATYGKSTATIVFTVHAQDGVSAYLFPVLNPILATASWTPPGGVSVAAGSTVTFAMMVSPGLSHNVVFDAVQGAPDDITQNGKTNSANRVFSTPGIFTFTCTLHGESGMVTVIAQ
jgi:hypothetical protein